MSTKSTVTASDLRAYFNADPKRLATLSDRARHTVEYVDGKAPRGQVSPEAIEIHNKRRKVQYVRGASRTAAMAKQAEAKALREAAKAAGHTVGSRGPLPKSVLAQSKG